MKIQKSETVTVAVIAALCLFFAITSWGKVFELIDNDIGRWLDVMDRVLRGQEFSRDYAWQYGPLPVFLLKITAQTLGATFAAAQILLDVQSALVVALAYILVRRWFPKNMHLAVMVLFICTLATGMTYFSLFSLLTYSIASPGAAIGCLLLVLGADSYLGGSRSSGLVVLATGSFISLLTKQDAMITAPVIIVIVLLLERSQSQLSIRRAALLCAACLLPGCLAYLPVISSAGLEMVVLNLGSFGLASGICPWWPTGFGLLGVLSALGSGIGVMCLLMIPDWGKWKAFLGPRLRHLVLLAIAGVPVFVLYERLSLDQLGAPGALSLLRIVKQVLGLDTTFRPVQWFAICITVALFLKALRAKEALSTQQTRIFLLSAVVAMTSSRGWFGNALGVTPEIPAVSHPFVLILGPFLLLHWLGKAHGIRDGQHPAGRYSLIVASLAFAYAAMRVAGSYPELISDRKFTPLHTAAGNIKLKSQTEGVLYNYVESVISNSESLLEIPMNGGFNFAMKRRNPAYNSLYWEIRPAEKFMVREAERIAQDPPGIIVAKDEPRYGIYYGYPYRIACSCPRIVWLPHDLAGDLALILPIERFINANYSVDRRIGEWVILRRNPAMPVAQ